MSLNKVRVRSTAFVLAATCLAMTAACTSEKSGSGATSSDEIAIGLVTKTNSNPYFVALRESAQAESERRGVKLIALAGKFDGDNQGQVDAINNLVAQNVKGILITPSSSKGVLGAIAAARAEGILVIALDTATDPADAVDATFATDNKAAGVAQGTYVRAALASRTPNVLLLDGTPGSTVDDQRHQGFLEGFGITEKSAEIKGAAVTNGDQTKAQTAMENLLQRAPGVNAVYTINEPAAAGAAKALAARPDGENVVVGSIDGSCTGVRNVRDGRFAATVMQFPEKMAQLGVAAVVEHAENGVKPSGFTDTGSQLITDKPVPGVPSKDTAWGLRNCWG
ncbi:substrate-binding domain-containing protein [Streptomyces sp. TRM64462]|uniref:substrate-binding domain-containing protein n=1 Tax=Streptomyces sp. TRM64462 TaxID=2741726 RepID=UPI0015864FED|nr:substrate-binding domain-containing protein [Streptomyces sp. TRM64462]